MPPSTRPLVRAIERTYRQPPTRLPPTINPSHTRPFTNTPRTHTQSEPKSHYDFFPLTFPTGPSFTGDLRSLRKEFLSLQSKSHPDRAPQNQKAHYEALSARINEAYKTLQDPLRRAQYLLSQRGIDVEDESAKLSEGQGDAGLLMEVMEAREAVEEVEGEEELVGLKEENNERIEASVKVLEEAFREEDLQKAAKEAIRLRYWVNINESIAGWEKGKGGGILHH